MHGEQAAAARLLLPPALPTLGRQLPRAVTAPCTASSAPQLCRPCVEPQPAGPWKCFRVHSPGARWCRCRAARSCWEAATSTASRSSSQRALPKRAASPGTAAPLPQLLACDTTEHPVAAIYRCLCKLASRCKATGITAAGRAPGGQRAHTLPVASLAAARRTAHPSGCHSSPAAAALLGLPQD